MNNIDKVIWDSGLRKNYIAKEMGVLPSMISMWISGERKPNSERIRMLCKILKCKVRNLYPEGVKNG